MLPGYGARDGHLSSLAPSGSPTCKLSTAPELERCPSRGPCVIGRGMNLSRQIYAVPDLCCIVTRRSVESVGGVFDPIVSSALAVFEYVKDELTVIPCLLLAAL